MEEREKEEKELALDVIDMIRYFALRWRRILAAMLIGGILLLGVGALRKYHSSHKETEKETEADAEANVAAARAALEGSGEEGELNALKAENAAELYLILEKEIEDKEDYFNHSILMQTNCAAVPQIQIQYYLSGNKNSRNIIMSLDGFLMDEEVCGKAAKVLGLDEVHAGYAQELVKISDRNNNNQKKDPDILDNYVRSGSITIFSDSNEEEIRPSLTDSSEAVMFVDIIAADRQSCEALAGVVREALLEKVQKLKEYYGDFSMQEIGSSYRESVSLLLQYEQEQKQEELNLKRKARISCEDSLTENSQISYYRALIDLQKEKEEEPEEIEETNILHKIRRGISLRFLLVGMVLGAFLICVYYGYIYLFGTSIKTGDEYEALYGIHVIQRYGPEKNRWKGPLGFLDRWISSWGRKKWVDIPEEEKDRLVISELCALIKKKELRSIHFILPRETNKTGIRTFETGKRLLQGLQKEVPDVILTSGGSVIEDSCSLKDLSSSEGAVFTAAVLGTDREILEKDFDTCKRFEVDILGVVIVDEA